MYKTSVFTALGPVWIIYSDRGVRRLILPGFPLDEETASASCDQGEGRPAYIPELDKRLGAYFKGVHVSFDFPLDLSGIPGFHLKVWTAAATIPYGEVRSYGWVADEISSPNSARAVGQALARNPVPILIPCHRVIRSDGTPGGFAGKMSSVETKLKLLSLEGYAFNR